ncbi:MAG: patatin-like phospholipase family protein [Burkholderiales bacterium]|nr:patatin-like phospholipase family protein [Burkholderiales bacterium]
MKVGVALGSGSARGFAHIGILEVLLENGIKPDVVAGTSIGAIIGAAYATGNLQAMKTEALGINRLNWGLFFNPSFSFDGWINLKHYQHFLVKGGVHRKRTIESLPIAFGTVACDLYSGKEIWLTKGSIFDAVWPSMLMPGVFPPVKMADGRWGVDGGIVNPVPVSLCRALGADIVIAVNLNSDLISHQPSQKHEKKPSEASKLLEKAFGMLPSLPSLPVKLRKEKKEKKERPYDVPEDHPDFFETIGASINIAQDRITKSRLAGDPPDLILSPKLSHIGIFETYRAAEAINEGRKCAEYAMHNIKSYLDNMGYKPHPTEFPVLSEPSKTAESTTE